MRPGQIEDDPVPEDDSPVKRMTFKKPEEFKYGDLARKWVTAVRSTSRAGELTYGAADGMMKGLLKKGAKPEDIYHAIDAWAEDPETDKRLRTSDFSVWQDFSGFFRTYKGRKRRDALVVSNDNLYDDMKDYLPKELQ